MTSDMRPGRVLALQGQAMRRFPVAYLAFCLLFVLSLFWIHDATSLVDEDLFEIGLSGFVTAGMMAIASRLFLETTVAGKMPLVLSVFQRKDGTLSPMVAPLPGLFCLGLCLFFFAEASSESAREYQALFLIPAAILFLLAAFLRPGSASQTLAAGIAPEDLPLFHWQCARHDGLAFAFAFLLSFVTMLGLFAAIAALDKLSLFGNTDDLYASIALFCIILLFPALGMAGLLQLDQRLPREESCLTIGTPEFFKIALWFRLSFSYLIVPLALLYMVILYAYLGQMVVLQDWPKNGVGLFIGVYLAFGFAVLMTCFGLRETEPVWVRAYERFFPYAVLPLALTLLIASVVRMSAYGVTEPRYFLALFVIWLNVASVLLIFRRPKLYIFPLSLAGLLALASFGPWGAQSLSLMSQKQELRHLLDAMATQTQDDQIARLRSIQDFFETRHAFDQIESIFAAHTLSKTLTRPPVVFNSFWVNAAPRSLHSIKDYDWQARFYLTNYLYSKAEDGQKRFGALSMALEQKSTRLHISGKTADQQLVFDFADLVASVKDPKDTYRTLPSQKMTFEKQAGGFHVRLYVENAHYEWEQRSQRWVLGNLEGHLFFRFASEKDRRTDRLKNAL